MCIARLEKITGNRYWSVRPVSL